MTLNTMDKLVTALCASTAQRKSFWKNPAGGTSGQWHSLWQDAGAPVAGSTPTVVGSGGDVPTKSTNGAIPGLADPGGVNVLYLARAELEADLAIGWLLYDRLYESSGFSGTSTSVQSITSPAALTRPDANGAGTELWLEVYTATGSTARTCTALYTNQDGTASRSATCTLFASPEAGAFIKFALQAGDTGVRSVQSVQLSGSTGTAGNFGVTIARRLLTNPVLQRQASYPHDLFSSGMPTIDTGACLALAVLTAASAGGLINGQLGIVEG